jgi:hypothetical protein
MSERYKIGFPEGVHCIMAEDYPKLIPIVDINQFGYGELVAFAPCQTTAKSLALALNLMEAYNKTWVADQ